jgi:hypothetical protein
MEETMRRKLGFLTIAVAMTIPTLVKAAEIDWKKVDAAFGKSVRRSQAKSIAMDCRVPTSR